MKYRYVFILLLLSAYAKAQVLGGRQTFAFLDLPPSPQVTALGGITVSQQGTDLSLGLMNPALLRSAMHTQLQVGYSGYPGGVRYSNFAFAYHVPSIATTFATSIQYTGYGAVTHTDAAGNVLGSFRPVDFYWQVSASRRYLEKWAYGISFKYIRSRYLDFRATGFGTDVGIAFRDTASGWQAGLLAKNMGTQFSKYTAGEREGLPFDLQAGVSKRLKHVPLQLSATLHHIYQFDVRYADPAAEENIIIENGDTIRRNGGAMDNIFRHFVLAAQFEIGQYVEVTAGYNHLRRRELALPNQGGLSGFSFGLGVIVKKIQLRYARSWYQRSIAFNHIGLSLPLNQWTGFGKFGDRIGWKPDEAYTF
ncbi:MAG: type IX secretion system protein PorQ [Chitinophaga sp.]